MGAPSDDDLGLMSTSLPDMEQALPTVSELRSGMVLTDTYRLESRLGRGGMGEVWKAAHLRLPKPVAIKVLLPAVSGSGEVLERFKREAEIGSRLAHPNIVHVLDFNALEDGRNYIVMEFLEGESLAARMERGSLSRDEVRAILEQAGLALKVAHDAGVVHRDLKPDNIFLATDLNEAPPFRVKLLDLRSARPPARPPSAPPALPAFAPRSDVEASQATG